MKYMFSDKVFFFRSTVLCVVYQILGCTFYFIFQKSGLGNFTLLIVTKFVLSSNNLLKQMNLVTFKFDVIKHYKIYGCLWKMKRLKSNSCLITLTTKPVCIFAGPIRLSHWCHTMIDGAHAGAWESNEWTKQEISLDQLVLPAQDKTR